MARILVADPIAAEGIELLKELGEVDVRTGLSEDELCEAVADCDALVVRSQTKVTERVLEAGVRLQVVGRAGVGVDNIDLEAATRSGIAVVNAPTGNIVAAAEHTIALMLAAARMIPQAHASLISVQWRRSEFTGLEIRRKTLGLVGLGRVGAEVARRANGLEMRVLAYDPFVTAAPCAFHRCGVGLVRDGAAGRRLRLAAHSIDGADAGHHWGCGAGAAQAVRLPDQRRPRRADSRGRFT